MSHQHTHTDFYALDKAAPTTAYVPDPERDAIAIIGMSCRFPGGAHNLDAYWQLMCQSRDAIVEVPPDRWNINVFYDPKPGKRGKVITYRGGFLQQPIDQMDAQFFGISPREAAYLDPQQRLLLEVAWEALEDAGLVPEHLAGSPTGVFMGAFTLDYQTLQFSRNENSLIEGHTSTGSVMTMVANRLSYVFDFCGPSMAVDTACSSSLVALHLACQSIRNGESTLALAGGVNVMIGPEFTIAESQGGFLSPDGRCKTFDARANGYVRGEGAGVVVLKPLAQALADGDPIYALIRATGVNQDGHTNGITVPSGAAQERLMRAVYRRAGLAPGQIQYVEAHGTGTPVGDPIEANALGKVLSTDRPDGDVCVVGSVKTNMGHTEAAAGIAGVIKTALCLKHRQIPPILHFQQPNPAINFEQLRLRLPKGVEPWPTTNGVALAGINSFGFGGTNAHAVLQEAPAQPLPATAADDTRQAYLLPVSARSAPAREAQARAYRDFLAQNEHVNLHDICYSAALRRSHHDYRLALVGASRQEMIEKLDAFLAGEASAGLVTGRKLVGDLPRMAFVFTGMGPQWWAMGRELLDQEPLFRNVIETCDQLLRQYTSWSLLEELTADERTSRMHETRIAQPANFALQVALAALWHAWGIVPDAIVGHSAGEIAAMYMAGALSLEDAIRIIYYRSNLQHHTTGMGKMVAVGISQEEAERAIADHADQVSIAGINSPRAVTLAGDEAALEEVLQPLRERDLFCRYLHVEVPYHSHYMEPLRAELLAALKDLQPRAATIPLYSTVTGAEVDGSELNADYWWQNVRNSVLFAKAADALIRDECSIFVEIGPHPVLAGSITECLMQRQEQGVVLPSLRRKEPEQRFMLGSLAALYTQGYAVNWETFYPKKGAFVRLPTYPWQRERYWVESEDSHRRRLGIEDHALLGHYLRAVRPSWELQVIKRRLPYLDDHRIQGTVLMPGAAFIEMVLVAAREAFGAGTYVLEDIEFHKALFLPDDEEPVLQTVLEPEAAAFEIYGRAGEQSTEWVRHVSARLHQYQNLPPQPVDPEQVCGSPMQPVTQTECYQSFAEQGFEYGPCFQGIARLWKGAGEALAEIRAPEQVAEDIDQYQLHPAILDACFQTLIAADLPAGAGSKADAGTYLPVGIRRIHYYGHISRAEMWARAHLVEYNDTLMEGDIRLFDNKGNPLLLIEGFRAQSLKTARSVVSKGLDAWLYHLEWQPKAYAGTEQSNGVQPTAPGGSRLIFADSGGVGAELIRRLEAQGETCIVVLPGAAYQFDAAARRVWINPTEPGDYVRVVREALPDDVACRGIVHLWSLEAAPATNAMTLEELDTAQNLGSIAVCHIVQAISAADWRSLPRLWLATRGAQPVRPHDAAHLALAQSPLWGTARVLGHMEHLALWGGIIDLDPANPTADADALFQQIRQSDGEDQVAFRDGERYVARMMPAKNLANPIPPRFRRDGSYLITGGLGALGLLVARWMVERGANRLILMSRRTFPARATWNQIAPQSTQGRQIAAIRELEHLGASIHLAAVDVTDEAQLTDFLGEFRGEHWPPIRGVIHSAGVVQDQIILRMDAPGFNQALHPKVRGAWALHRVLADEPLEFFVLFSSIGSLVVSVGQSNYAAGNAFLDALAFYRRAQDRPARSIGWGPWAMGMVTEFNLIDSFARRGMYTISEEQGMQVMSRLLGRDFSHLAVMDADWPLVCQSYSMGIVPPMVAHLAETETISMASGDNAQPAVSILAQLAGTAEQERQTLLADYLHELVAKVLRIQRSRFDLQQPLNTLGMDSMIAIELKNQIDHHLRVNISVVDLLQGSSVMLITSRLLPQLAFEDQPDEDDIEALLQDIEQLSEEEAQQFLSVD
jgi:acyl transferase domain-containing protein